MPENNIIIYVDGCRKGCGTGGWAYIIMDKDNFIFGSGYAYNTTNNMTELFAPIKALAKVQELGDNRSIKLISDSKYLVDGFNSWMHSWKRKGWVRNHKENGQVLNLNLWKILHERHGLRSIRAEWVRGHTGIAGNEFCDALANYSVKNKCFINGSVPSSTVLQQLVKRSKDFINEYTREDPYYLTNNKSKSESKEWKQESFI